MLATTRMSLPTIGAPMNVDTLTESVDCVSVIQETQPQVEAESPNQYNPCKVKTSSRRYRNDPYQAQVIPEPVGMRRHQLEPLAHFPSAHAALLNPRQLPSLGGTIAHRFGFYAPSEGPGPLIADPFRRQAPFASKLDSFPHVPHVPNLNAKPFAPPRPTSQEPDMPITHRTRGLGPRTSEPSNNERVDYEQYVLVRFRRNQYTYGFDGSLKKDDNVVVSGDRGEHMGVVIDEVARKPKGYVGPVLRVATEDDLNHLSVVRREEAAALETCRQFVQNLCMHDSMSIADVEWQTDYQKLTVFFEPVDKEQFVDFRRLQRALFTHFRCRIWLIDA